MRYDDQDRESSNVEDRRGQRSGFPFPGRGIRIPIGGRGGGFSITTLLIIGAVMLMFGINPLDILTGGSGGGGGFPRCRRCRAWIKARGRQPIAIHSTFPGCPVRGSRRRASQARAVTRWGRSSSACWPIPKTCGTVSSSRSARTIASRNWCCSAAQRRTACGTGMSAMGPFYCPLDQKIYIDLTFYEQLKRRFKAPGDFAQAYVIAHEVGHHVQKLLASPTRCKA